MNSSASSKLISRGGVNRIASSVPEERTFVSFLPFDGLTIRSFSRLWSPNRTLKGIAEAWQRVREERARQQPEAGGVGVEGEAPARGEAEEELERSGDEWRTPLVVVCERVVRDRGEIGERLVERAATSEAGEAGMPGGGI